MLGVRLGGGGLLRSSSVRGGRLSGCVKSFGPTSSPMSREGTAVSEYLARTSVLEGDGSV
jgi:hypothetical protein